MKEDEIIEMAIDAGLTDAHYENEILLFAKLVAAKEREACAKLIEPDKEHRRDASWGYLGGDEGVELLDGAATKIRARGEA